MSSVPFPIHAGSLVVSCQAPADSPLHGPAPMAMMARAVVAGGAQAIRADGPASVAAIRRVTDVPVIGIYKQGDRDGVSITPTVAAAAEVVQAGADLVAIDATTRPRADGSDCAEQIAAIHDRLGVPVVADVDDLEAGRRAYAAGADAVATTLSGYTGGVTPSDSPDFALVAALAAEVGCPVVAEGRYATAGQVLAALTAGAHAVVVGTAITDPMTLTARLIDAITTLAVT